MAVQIHHGNTLYAHSKDQLKSYTGSYIAVKDGSLEPGYHFNAIVIDNMEDKNIPLTQAERIERFCYMRRKKHSGQIH